MASCFPSSSCLQVFFSKYVFIIPSLFFPLPQICYFQSRAVSNWPWFFSQWMQSFLSIGIVINAMPVSYGKFDLLRQRWGWLLFFTLHGILNLMQSRNTGMATKCTAKFFVPHEKVDYYCKVFLVLDIGAAFSKQVSVIHHLWARVVQKPVWQHL